MIDQDIVRNLKKKHNMAAEAGESKKVQFQLDDKSISLPQLEVKGVDKAVSPTVKYNEAKKNYLRSESPDKAVISFLPVPKKGLDEEDERLAQSKPQKKHQKNLDWTVEFTKSGSKRTSLKVIELSNMVNNVQQAMSKGKRPRKNLSLLV